MSLHKITVVPWDGQLCNGTKVFIDGQEVQGLIRASVKAEVGSVWRVVLELEAEIDWQKPQREGTA